MLTVPNLGGCNLCPCAIENSHIFCLTKGLSSYLHYQLMGTSDKCQTVGVIESLRDVLSKSVTGTTGGDSPTTTIIGVTPKKITHRTLNMTKIKKKVGF